MAKRASIRLVRGPKPALIQRRSYRKEVRKDFNKNADDAERAYRRVVRNWSPSTRPTFKAKSIVTLALIGITLEVTEADRTKPVWKWVNTTGTKAHDIEARRTGGVLAFAWGGPGSYQAKTRTGPARFGGPGTVVGGVATFRPRVRHPGFEARRFDKVINPTVTKDQTRRLNNAKKRHLRGVTR